MTERNGFFSIFRPPLTGRHVLAMIVAFFLVIFAVNGVFVYVSLNSHPGVSSEDAYRKGLDYNRTLEQADRQNARGWKTTVTFQDGFVVVSLTDRTGAPLTGLAVRGEARRPVHDRADTALALSESAPGQYRAATRLAPGRWELMLTAATEGLPVYRIERSLVGAQ
jgi:nitrogen fixation protein FixH